MLDLWKHTVGQNATLLNLISILREHDHTAEVVQDLRIESGKKIFVYFTRKSLELLSFDGQIELHKRNRFSFTDKIDLEFSVYNVEYFSHLGVTQPPQSR